MFTINLFISLSCAGILTALPIALARWWLGRMAPSLRHPCNYEGCAQDPELVHAMTEAKTSFSTFLRLVTLDDGTINPAARVKLMLRSADSEVFVWVYRLRRKPNGTHEGTIVNTLGNSVSVSHGDVVEFTFGAICDWGLKCPGGTLYGFYTTRLLLPYMERSQRLGVQARLAPPGLTPLVEAYRASMRQTTHT